MANMLTFSTQQKDIKPVLCGYIGEAHLILNPGKVPDDKAVHDVRVLMKKSRATIKLLKTFLDAESFDREYNTLREVGRIMRSWRETSVHRKLLKSLKKKYPAIFKKLSEDKKISLLLSKPIAKKELSREMMEDLDTILSLLHKSVYRLRFRNMDNLDPVMVIGELEKTYCEVSNCYLKARNYPKSVNLHEFRKKTKDFLYQLFFFRSLNAKVIKSLEKRLDSLGQNLGKYNDHAVLIQTLGYRYRPGGSSSEIDDLILMLKQEQDRYLSKIWPSAYRIFRPGKKLAGVLGLKEVVI